MPYMGGLVLLIMIVALVDIVTSDEAVVRGLPRWGWLLLVIVLPLVGSIVWFVAGRPVEAFSGRLTRDTPGTASATRVPRVRPPRSLRCAGPRGRCGVFGPGASSRSREA